MIINLNLETLRVGVSLKINKISLNKSSNSFKEK